MSTRILSITLLLLSVCLCAHSFQGSRRHATNNRVIVPLCCTQVSSVDINRQIIGHKYEKQTAKDKCVEAIILRKSDGKVCVDPEAEWVKKLITNMTHGNP